MNAALMFLSAYWWIIPIVAGLAGYKLVLRLFGVLLIPDDSIGIVNKRFVLFGSHRTLPDGRIVALHGEAGIQADPLPPGIHFLYWPWQFEIEVCKFTAIPEGQVGVVQSRDGNPLERGRLLAKGVECDNYQDARAFLANGGQRGPQMAVITPGTYRINTGLFSVTLHEAKEITDNCVGIVTTKDGQPLKSGDIAGKEIEGHKSFQNGDAFIENGGYRGLQEQVLLAGRYYLNPLFVSIEVKPMTMVPIANAGVMVSYVGEEGKDLTGETFQHGNQVSKGQKGVWNEALDPGKYPVNPYTHSLIAVSTANIVLNWATGRTESHQLDQALSTIALHTKDGFTLSLDVSVIIHIPRNDAPKVIARFGSVENLVTQVLEPLISNHFRNAGQKGGAIDFLQNRSERQKEAREAIKGALQEYNVIGVDTLIGDIKLPAELMKTLTDRQLAEQQKLTYETQRAAADAQKALEQAAAVARTQAKVVEAERTVEINTFEAKAAVEKAKGQADAARTKAEADAFVATTVGKAQGEAVLAVGEAEAKVIDKKTKAVGQDKYAVMEVAKSLASSKQELVPRILVAGGKDGNGGTVGMMDLMAAQMMTGGLLGNGGSVGQASASEDETSNDADAATADTVRTIAPATANGATKTEKAPASRKGDGTGFAPGARPTAR